MRQKMGPFMIAMSDVRRGFAGRGFAGRAILRRLLYAGTGALLLAAAVGCATDHACTAIGCLDGLTVSLDGNFEPGSTYRIDVNQVSGNDATAVMSCTWTPTAPALQPPVCTSSIEHAEFGSRIQIRSNTLTKVKVAVTKDDVFVGEESFEPKYAAREINGEGCGTCTQASISVTVPKS